jgi:magnesium transporter
VVRIHDISESLRDLISGSLETYLSVVSNRTNDIMKTLTIVTVMFMPMTFLVGFFGMNFFGETLALSGPFPRRLLFWSTVAIMAVSPCFIWAYARRKKWF